MGHGDAHDAQKLSAGGLCRARPAFRLFAPERGGAPEAPSPKGDLVALSDAQVGQLGIVVEAAIGDAPIPLASVPGTVSCRPKRAWR
jgi:hypothetical protein